MTEVLNLADRLDHAQARALYAEITAKQGADLTVEGREVVFCGALTAQILLTAARHWKAAGHTFRLLPSSAMQDDLERLGILGEIAQEEMKECC